MHVFADPVMPKEFKAIIRESVQDVHVLGLITREWVTFASLSGLEMQQGMKSSWLPTMTADRG